jgi:hypothetical protein
MFTCFGLLCNAVGSSDCISSNGKIITNEKERILKEAVTAYSKAFSRQSPGWIDENHGNPQSG